MMQYKVFSGYKYDGCLIFTQEKGFCRVFVFFQKLMKKMLTKILINVKLAD